MRFLPALLIVCAACSSSGEDPFDPSGDGGNEDIPGDPPTYHEDVAPILMASCAGCHAPGGIAPFTLLSYQDAVDAAPIMGHVVSERIMPPWNADNSGDCHTWKDARTLTDDQIDVIVAWADGDRLEGDPAASPEPPDEQPGLPRVDATLDIGVDYTPQPSLSDDYRCFVVDYDVPEGKFLTAFEVRPGEPRVVHHILVYTLNGDSDVAAAEALDANDATPGYQCFGGPSVGSTLLAVWAPGVRVSRYPDTTGLPVPPARKMVLQIHYNLEAGPLPDRTRIDLELADTVASPAFLALVADLDLYLPPQQQNVVTSGTLGVPGFLGPYKVWAQFPHMHTLGRTLQVDLERDGESSCMINVPRWDFHWQQGFIYDDGPITVLGGDTIRVTCSYDTTDRPQPVTWGEGTQDEMCLSFLYTTTP